MQNGTGTIIGSGISLKGRYSERILPVQSHEICIQICILPKSRIIIYILSQMQYTCVCEVRVFRNLPVPVQLVMQHTCVCEAKYMKSKKQNNRYIIQESEREAPVKIYAKKTDATLEKLKRQSEALRRTVKQIYDTDYDLYRILDREIFCTSGLDLEDGSNWRLDLLSDEIKYLQSRLNEQDDDLEAFQFQKNTAITLYDLGFRKRYGTSDWMEKIIEDSDEKEVVEEIQYKDPANLVRRLRTVYWEKTDYGKTSKDIRYKKLQIGKKLMMAIQNTVKVQAP